YTPGDGETSVYYQETGGLIAYYQWQPGRGWVSGVLGKGHEAADSSPATVDDQSTGETSVYYENAAGSIAWFQFHPGKGWEEGVL
ncbi:MAG TPA: hypothetical protein VIH71_15205, partial [Solirubrobacteraceae bacterium]